MYMYLQKYEIDRSLLSIAEVCEIKTVSHTGTKHKHASKKTLETLKRYVFIANSITD